MHRWIDLRERIENNINDEIDLELIKVFVHESYGSRAVTVGWSFQEA